MKMKQISIRKYSLVYLLLTLCIVTALGAISFISFKEVTSEQAYKQQIQELKVKAQGISHSVGFYREIVRQLSVQNKVKNLVLFESFQKAQDWAIITQKLLPESIGLALFDEEGNVLGHPAELSLGPTCIADLKAHLSNKQVDEPTVHDEKAGKEHFDITENIIQDGEVIGVIFASFSLRTMQKELDRMVSEGQHISIISNTGQLIAQSGKLAKKSYMLKEKLPISGTDWYMEVIVEEYDFGGALVSHAIASIILLICVCTVFYFFLGRLVRVFSEDFDVIRKLLKSVRDNKKVRVNVHSKLLETEGIVQDIRDIIEDINSYHQLLIDHSVTDDLTGLFNRRAFYQEMIRFMDLSNRDVDIVVVTLDLDHLKYVNDAMGHETGDQILVQFAHALRARSRDTDYCARVGGDEFWVVLVKCTADQVGQWYTELVEDFQNRQRDVLGFSTDDQQCGVSAGYTVIEKDDQETKNVLKRADEALYRAKSNGRGNMQGFRK
jgi:diguanylate cyclase (GGDEF)-like protein